MAKAMNPNIRDAYRLRDFDKHKAAEARAKADARPRVQMQVRHEHQVQAVYKGHDLHIWRDDYTCNVGAKRTAEDGPLERPVSCDGGRHE